MYSGVQALVFNVQPILEGVNTWSVDSRPFSIILFIKTLNRV